MCEFLSFSVHRSGQIFCLLGEERQKVLLEGNNPDSHSFISDYFHVDEDETWKFEIPLDKSDIDTLCGGNVPEKLQLRHFEQLRQWYDGGISIDEMPAEIAESTIKWLCEHLEEIKEAGILKFSSPIGEQILDSSGQEVIELSIARLLDQLAHEIAKAIVARDWGWDASQIASLIVGNKGWFREWREEGHTPSLCRMRVRLLNFPSGVVMRIFISRYQAPFISRPADAPPEAGVEDRIFVYPVLQVRKEGEK